MAQPGTPATREAEAGDWKIQGAELAHTQFGQLSKTWWPPGLGGVGVYLSVERTGKRTLDPRNWNHKQL